jgi:hypothetical protein
MRRAKNTTGKKPGETAGLALWVTCCRDGREHAVRSSELDAGKAGGRFLAVCGHTILPGSIASPPGPRCVRCAMSATSAGARR